MNGHNSRPKAYEMPRWRLHRSGAPGDKQSGFLSGEPGASSQESGVRSQGQAVSFNGPLFGKPFTDSCFLTPDS